MDQQFQAHDRGIRKYVSRYIDSLPDLTGKVVVDIPCGDGHSSSEFRRKGATVKSFDLYPEFMKAAEIEAHYADLSDRIPMEDASADFLICQEGIEHMPDQMGVFREFNRVLKKGGTLIITTPSISHARARLSMLLLESDFWRRSAPTELDSVWFSDENSDRLGFGHLFLIGVHRLQTMVTLSGFEVTSRLNTIWSGTAVVLGVLLYPLFVVSSLFAYLSYRRKNKHVEKDRRDAILWSSVKLNLSPTTVFCKHIFWIMQKRKEYPEVVADMKALTRHS